MAQFARPISTVTIGDWVDQIGGTTNIHETIDEATPSDTDYIQTPITPDQEVYVCKLSPLTDPISSTGHTLRWRRSKDSLAGTLNLTVELRQGYVSEGSQGTLIASKGPTAMTTTFLEDSLSLTGTQIDAITDYTDLYLRFIADQV